MDEFKTGADLVTKMKADLGNVVYPKLLTSIAAAARAKLLEKADELRKARVEMKVQEPTVFTIPPRAVVASVGRDTKLHIDAIKEAYEGVYRANLDEKMKLLKFLREAGVT